MTAVDTAFQAVPAGALSLDFVNTLADRPQGRQESLQTWTDLVAWGTQARLVPPGRTRPRRSAMDLRTALRLRECLYRVFTAVSTGRRVARADLNLFQRHVARTLSHARLTPCRGRLAWTWMSGRSDRDVMLDAVVRAAVGLLTSPEAARVRQCEGETCSWLFIDRSRGGRRRWCSMKTCGNRAKAHRFYQRRSG